MKKTFTTLAIASLAAGSAQAVVVAQYGTFTHANDVAQIATDSSTQTDWTTTVLIDQATGTGALGATNQNASSNRQEDTFTSGVAIGLSITV